MACHLDGAKPLADDILDAFSLMKSFFILIKL